MKCYTEKEEEKKLWIKSVSQPTDNEYKITYADGSSIPAVVNERNCEILEEELEIQADKAVAKLPRLKLKKTLSGVMTGAALVGIPAACYEIASIPAVQDLVTSQDSVKVALGVGTVTLLGFIPFFSKFLKERAKVAEAKKIKYRNDNREVLDSYRKYPTSLLGLSSKTRRHFEEENDPMSMLYLDYFTEKDLRSIYDNICREAALGLSYEPLNQKVKK